MVYIIVKDRQSSMNRIKGKTVAEFDRNMEKEGWPSEFATEEDRDRVAFEEKKRGHALHPEETRVTNQLPLLRKLQEADRKGEIREVNIRDIEGVEIKK